MDQASPLKFLQRPSNSWPRNSKLIDEVSLRRNPVARLIVSGLNPLADNLEYSPMLGVSDSTHGIAFSGA
jgi:hypothetical protein